MYFLSFRIFEQLALALKNRVCPENFHAWGAAALPDLPPLTPMAVNLSDQTHNAYLLSSSLASCNLKNGFRRFVPHIIGNNNQFSTPKKENAHRH